MTVQDEVLILKLGSSVLGDRHALDLAVQEIYRHLRAGRRVLAVVSALQGVTDDLLSHCEEFGPDADQAAVAAYVATGERAACALLVLALDRSGVPALLLEPAAVALRSTGERLDAEPASVDAVLLRHYLALNQVAVFPGFFCTDAGGQHVLFGRGGSDITALFLAKQLHGRCLLLKDVDGLYAQDPAKLGVGAGAQKFLRARWETAARLGGQLIQSKAVEFARRQSLDFSVGRCLDTTPTLIGAFSDECRTDAAEPVPLRVLLLGLGTVGFGVYERLSSDSDRFRVEKILVRSPERHAGRGVPPDLLTSQADGVSEASIDLVVDALAGDEPAGSLVSGFLARGIPVVSANKGMLVRNWERIRRYALGAQPLLRCSAAVGGAVPMLEALRRRTDLDQIDRVRGILNGTCNFLLDMMGRGSTYAGALQLAQERGLAEADPTDDVSGRDAASKAFLIVEAGLNSAMVSCEIDRSGIDSVAGAALATGSPHIGVARQIVELARVSCGWRASVGVRFLAPDDPLAEVRAENNVIEIYAGNRCLDRVGGKGAGRWPTATSVMADVYAWGNEVTSMR